MPFYLLTFRPQPTDFSLLNTFFTVLKPQLNDNPNVLNYACVIEKDNTINRHCHTLVEFKQTKTKDNQLKRFYNNKVFKEFNKMLKNVLTNERWAKDDRKLKDTQEDFLHVLGYVFKEVEGNKRFYTFKEQQIVDALEYYYQRERIDKSQPEEDDLNVLTSKTIHANVFDFCKKNDLRPKDQEMVKFKMIKAGYMFSQVQIKDTFQELDIHMNPDEYDSPHTDPKDFSFLHDKYMATIAQLNKYNDIFNKIEKECETATGVPLSKMSIYKLCKTRELFFDSTDSDEE